MPDPRLEPAGPRRPGRDDGMLVAAWLAGDLPPEDAAVLEDRLAREPELAERADRVARVLVTLRGVDAVDLPPGARERLRARLVPEAGSDGDPTGAVWGPAGGRAVGGATVADLAGARVRRGRARGLGVLAAAAAAVVVLAGLGGALRGLDTVRTGGAESAEESVALQAEEGAGDAPVAAGDEAASEAAAAEEGAASEAAEEAGGTAASGATAEDGATTGGAADAPVLADLGVALATIPTAQGPARAPLPEGSSEAAGGPRVLGASEEAALAAQLRERYAEGAEATALLGLDTSAATARAARAAAAIRAAGPFGSGVRPDACLDAALAVPDGAVVVPARVEAVTVDGEPALVYVLTVADPGTAAVGRVEVQAFDAASCARLAGTG